MDNGEIHPQARGLSGGKKQLWLRVHRQEVERYYFNHGAEATMRRFNMSLDTFERFWERKNFEVRISKLSANDRWVYMAAMESISEVRHQVAQLQERVDQFEPIIVVGRSLINATIGGMLSNLDKSKLLPPKREDPLSFKDFKGKSKN